MKKNKYTKGLALIELVIAMIVTSIIVTAVVTLAYALDTASDATDDTSKMQAQIRFADIRISDLIRHSKLVCYYAGTNDLAVWRADDDNNGKISISELVYIECGSAQDHLQLCEFTSSDTTAVDISSIGAFASNWWLTYNAVINYTSLIPECSNVQFGFDVLPPESEFVTISFKIIENGIERQCQINATLRGWAGNLLDGSGNIVGDDD
jgi:hypothetical protein